MCASRIQPTRRASAIRTRDEVEVRSFFQVAASQAREWDGADVGWGERVGAVESMDFIFVTDARRRGNTRTKQKQK